MTKPLRIVFMGTPEFAVHVLDRIRKDYGQVVGVVSVPDKPAGRGRKLHSSAVSNYANQHHLPLLQPEKLKSAEFISELTNWQADVFVVVAFRMLPKKVWEIPAKGTFNLHASLLPQYRGAAPINWVIINGETMSGVTTFLIDEKIDTGNILLQEKVDITPTETAGELHDDLMHVGGDLVVKTLKGLEDNTIEAKPQITPPHLKLAPKIFKEDCQINWNSSLQDVYNLIRGLSPYPTAWTHLKQDDSTKTLKIYRVSVEYEKNSYAIGKILIHKDKLAIAHSEGFIYLEEIQLEGKRKMEVHDFLNGFKLTNSTFVF